MITSVEIKLEPVEGSLSGEKFVFTSVVGVDMIIDGNDYDSIMTISDIGKVFFKIPVRNIRYIICK
jgi:hypothetical protein